MGLLKAVKTGAKAFLTTFAVSREPVTSEKTEKEIENVKNGMQEIINEQILNSNSLTILKVQINKMIQSLEKDVSMAISRGAPEKALSFIDILIKWFNAKSKQIPKNSGYILTEGITRLNEIKSKLEIAINRKK